MKKAEITNIHGYTKLEKVIHTIITIITMIVSFILFTGFAAPVYALSDAQSVAIQTLMDDACRISGVPGMSISIISGEETCNIRSVIPEKTPPISPQSIPGVHL